MKAAGEDNSAKLVAHCLKSLGVDASYLSPKAAGLILKKEPGIVTGLDSSFCCLKNSLKSDGIINFPGFFGYSAEGKVLTFSRGGQT